MFEAPLDLFTVGSLQGPLDLFLRASRTSRSPSPSRPAGRPTPRTREPRRSGSRGTAPFRAINTLQEPVRGDRGADGGASGERHPERDLLLPSARCEDGAQGS
ncbi:hypothetical protein SCWH03_49740 [Streptomyces pacificus]|uniref:Uncharacterized protein n=1 Tax=Streptomyces pacificus TaxID=2705029 RepID=A0A6A0B0S7_9ACTN|nr:hypothetical protein SCWH03_49740 [Streptomyces pacificus]